MLIRERGNTVKLIRAERDPEAPRARQKVIGTLRRHVGPSTVLLASLSGDEQTALARWLSVQHDRHQKAHFVVDTGLPPGTRVWWG